MKLLLFARLQNSHPCLECRGVAPEYLFHEPPSIWSQFQNRGSPVAWCWAADYETLCLQAIDGSGHRAAGQQHLALDFGNCQRTLMQKGFEGREIGEAQSGFLDAMLRDLA